MLGCVNEINSGGRPSLDDLVLEFFAKLLCMLNKNMNTAQLHIKLYFFSNGYVTSIQHKTVFKKTYLSDTYLLLVHVHAYKVYVIKKKADLHHKRNKIRTKMSKLHCILYCFEFLFLFFFVKNAPKPLYKINLLQTPSIDIVKKKCPQCYLKIVLQEEFNVCVKVTTNNYAQWLQFRTKQKNLLQ